MSYDILAEVLVILSAAVVIVTVLHRMRLPSVLGYLVVGLVAGPFGVGIVPTEDLTLLAELGIVFLLFTLGLEFSLPRVMAMKWEVFGLGGLQVILTVVVFGLAAWWLGLKSGNAVVVGGALALSSTALVIKQLSDQLELSHPHGRLATAILLFQDIAAVPLLVMIPFLAETDTSYYAADIGLAIAQGSLVLVVVLLTGRWLLRPLFHEIAHAHSAELFTLAVLLVVLAAGWATHTGGLSLALGAFVAGMMLSETEYRHQVEADIRPFRDVLLGLFFVTVGMQLDVVLLLRELDQVAVLVVALIAVKALLAGIMARGFAGDWRTAARTGVAVAQGGEFGLALISLAGNAGVLPGTVAQPVLAALVLSMLLSPLVIKANSYLTDWIPSAEPDFSSDLQYEPSTGARLVQHNHVVICGYGRVGQNVARLLEDEGFEYLALDLDPVRVRRARQGGDTVYYGDAAKAEILERVGLARARAVVISFSDPIYANRIVETVRQSRTDVPILVRTRDDAYLDLLQQSGATVIVPEAMESSLTLASHVLNLLSVPLPKILRTIQRVRNHRYGELRSIFPKEAARTLDETHAFREQLATVALPPGAAAVGQRLANLELAESDVSVTAIRRDGITGRQPSADTELREGDVLVLYGTPEALEHAEALLLNG